MARFSKAPPDKKPAPPALPQEFARVVSAPAGSPETERPAGPSFLLELQAQAAEGRSQDCHVVVEHCSHQNWGARHENEDRVVFHQDQLPDSELRFYTVGVLDGHDTEQASDHVSRRLPHELGKRLKEGCSVVDAYTSAMAELEAQLRSVTATAGTCVLSCTIAGSFVWCANLGDCRAVLIPLAAPEPGDNGSQLLKPEVRGIHWMSSDLKASNPSEKSRIERAGGRVTDGRVEGLEPTRTLGDFDVKAATKKGVISIEPEVRLHELAPAVGSSTAQAVLMCATDGVWDVLSGQDVCNLIVARRDICKVQAALACGAVEPDRQVLKQLADDLVQFSIAKGSRDDCTAIVALISVQPCVADIDGRYDEASI